MRVSRALNRVAAQIQIEIGSVILCELAQGNANQFARFRRETEDRFTIALQDFSKRCAGAVADDVRGGQMVRCEISARRF